MSTDLVSRIARLELPPSLRDDAALEALVDATRTQLQAWAEQGSGHDPTAGRIMQGDRGDALQAALGRTSLLAVWQAREIAQLRARCGGTRPTGALWPRPPQAATQTREDELLHIAPQEVVRQVQQALDASMDRLDVACERFRAVSDAHELRLENLRKALDGERSDRDRALASVHTGGAQLALHIEAETRSLRAADQLTEGRLTSLHDRAEEQQGRLDRLRDRLHRQRESQRATEARLTELAQAVQLDHMRLQQRLHWLTLGALVAAATAAGTLGYLLMHLPTG